MNSDTVNVVICPNCGDTWITDKLILPIKVKIGRGGMEKMVSR